MPRFTHVCTAARHASRAVPLLPALFLSLALAGCSADHPTTPGDSPLATAKRTPGTEAVRANDGQAVHLEGQIGPGAIYSLDKPADWNGDLVLYVHGYTTPGFSRRSASAWGVKTSSCIGYYLARLAKDPRLMDPF